MPLTPHDLQRPPHERGGEEDNMAMSGKDELTPREREVLDLVKMGLARLSRRHSATNL